MSLRAEFCIGCHPTRPRNMISNGRNTFRPLSKAGLAVNRFFFFRKLTLALQLYRISRKFYKRYTRPTSGHKQKNGLFFSLSKERLSQGTILTKNTGEVSTNRFYEDNLIL